MTNIEIGGSQTHMEVKSHWVIFIGPLIPEQLSKKIGSLQHRSVGLFFVVRAWGRCFKSGFLVSSAIQSGIMLSMLFLGYPLVN